MDRPCLAVGMSGLFFRFRQHVLSDFVRAMKEGFFIEVNQFAVPDEDASVDHGQFCARARAAKEEAGSVMAPA